MQNSGRQGQPLNPLWKASRLEGRTRQNQVAWKHGCLQLILSDTNQRVHLTRSREHLDVVDCEKRKIQ